MARKIPPATRIALYGRTYLDVDVRLPLEAIAGSKSKMDAPVFQSFGGFACNGARAIAGRFHAGDVRVVTLASKHDLRGLEASLPAGIALDRIETKRRLPVSVILDPAGACRIFRDSGDGDAREWRIDRIPGKTLSARLHIVGRLPEAFATKILRHSQATRARFAWCGGSALSLALERECDLMCVNTAEARRLLESTEGTPRELAEALLQRSTPDGAVRVVTGGGRAPTAAVFRDGGSLCGHEEPAIPVAAGSITRLLGVGDAFAATFLAGACFDRNREERSRPAVARALADAQKMAARFITQ